MASTFRRRSLDQKNPKHLLSPSALTPPLPGTKPWTGGLTLTSSGLRDLDAIFLGGSSMGGLPLGSCVWLEEDRWTHSLALALIQYWCAEAISQGHCLMLPLLAQSTESSNGPLAVDDSKWEETDDSNHELCSSSSLEDVHQLLNSLPRNLHWDKAQQQQRQHQQETTSSVLDTLAEGNREEEEEEDYCEDEKEEEKDLKIAWQYKKSVQQERLGYVPGPGSTNPSTVAKASSHQEFCHSYDLQGRLADQVNVLEKSAIVTWTCSRCCSSRSRKSSCSRSCGFQLYQKLVREVQSEQQTKMRVIRLLFFRTKISVLSIALPLLLSFIRDEQLPVVVMVAIRPWAVVDAMPSVVNNLRRQSDVVLEAEGFASRALYPPPSEFRMFHGLLQVRKLATLTAATPAGHFADLTSSRQPTATLYGLKRDRRKLHIQLLHIPPEDYAEGGGSTAGGVRSGAGKPKQSQAAGLSCATSGGGDGPLDF